MFFNGPWGWRGRSAGNHGPCNRLSAIDIHKGSLVWEIGGAASGAHPLRQAGSIFLGPPLPLRGQLYVLAEVNDEIRLLALDADTGSTLWSQQLAVVQRNLFPDSLRRTAGLSPSYADGILVCPTGAGGVVAVDLATRSLRWGYRYSHERTGNSVYCPAADHDDADGDLCGRHAHAALAGRHGDHRRRPRADHPHRVRRPLCPGPYRRHAVVDPVARGRTASTWRCVHAGKIVLVGRHEVRAVNLADGTPAWTMPLPAGSSPSGRGFYTGNRYYRPPKQRGSGGSRPRRRKDRADVEVAGW